MRQTTTAEVLLDEGKATSSSAARRATPRFGCQRGWLRSNFVGARRDETENHPQQPGNLGMSAKQDRLPYPTIHGRGFAAIS